MASSGTTRASGSGWPGSVDAQRMVDVSIALFARFAGNAKIDDLVSMLGAVRS